MDTSSLPAIRFLLVDDLENNLLALESLLEREGVEFLRARSGPEALEVLLETEVSLAIIDVQMPDMNGFELADIMRGTERTRHIPIIFVTAGSRTQERLFQGYGAGAVDFLFKPLDPHIVRNKVETFYQLSRQRQLLAAQLREREELARQLRETLHLNEMFVAAMGHDMRNPLAAIVASAENLQSFSVDEEQKEIADRIHSSGLRMSRLLDDLYDLARARLSGGIPVEPQEVDLSETARAMIDEFRCNTRGKRVELTDQGAMTGTWDGDRLSQLLANLLSNAVRHGADDGAVSVDLDGRNEAEVVLSVHNEGTIPPEIRPHLFDPFRKTPSRRRDTQGLGLGLYIVQQIASAHGGTVDVESEEATGTTFRVHLPRGGVPAPASAGSRRTE